MGLRRLLPWVGLAVIYLCVRARERRATTREEWGAAYQFDTRLDRVERALLTQGDMLVAGVHGAEAQAYLAAANEGAARRGLA